MKNKNIQEQSHASNNAMYAIYMVMNGAMRMTYGAIFGVMIMFFFIPIVVPITALIAMGGVAGLPADVILKALTYILFFPRSLTGQESFDQNDLIFSVSFWIMIFMLLTKVVIPRFRKNKNKPFINFQHIKVAYILLYVVSAPSILFVNMAEGSSRMTFFVIYMIFGVIGYMFLFMVRMMQSWNKMFDGMFRS